MDLKQQIENGKPFKASLNFEKAGPVEIEFTVVAPGATPPAAAAAADKPAGAMPMGNMHGRHARHASALMLPRLPSPRLQEGKA